MQGGWKNWISVSAVLCERKMNITMKGKMHRTVVYGAETWAVKKAQGKKLKFADMRKLQ